MPGLDFSALNKIAYRGIEKPDDQKHKDAMIEQGYSVADDKDNPFLQASAPRAADKEKAEKKERRIEAFISSSGWNYGAMYRAAFDYHKRHTPPPIDADYWRTHTPGSDETPPAELSYWIDAGIEADRICKEFSGDKFMLDLMSDIYADIERQYKAAREEAARGRK